MAICDKCGKTYLTKVCIHCIGKESSKSTNEKDKLYKTIRYAIIFFIGILIIGTITEIYIIKKTNDAVEPIIKASGKAMNEILNTQNNLMKKINNGF